MSKPKKEIITPLRFMTFFIIMLILVGTFLLWDMYQNEKELKTNYLSKYNNLKNQYEEKQQELNNLQNSYDSMKVDSRKYYNLYSDTKKELKECENQPQQVIYKGSVCECKSCDYSNYVLESDYEKLYNYCDSKLQENSNQETLNQLVQLGIKVLPFLI